MPAKSECLQLLISHSTTPCFKALGSEPCDSPFCKVNNYLSDRGIDPFTIGTDGYVVDWSLHWVCPLSIHNDNLPAEIREKLHKGLIQNLNKR